MYADTGEGPPVVLFHGFPDTPSGWSSTAERLSAAGYRTIVPYLRGYHPATIVPGRRYRGRELGEDAIALLDALGLEQAVLVGHDWGAARRLPGRRARARARARARRRRDPAPAQDRALARAALARSPLHHAAPAERPVARAPQRLRLPRRADAALGAALVGPRARGHARRGQALLRRTPRARRGARLLPRLAPRRRARHARDARDARRGHDGHRRDLRVHRLRWSSSAAPARSSSRRARGTGRTARPPSSSSSGCSTSSPRCPSGARPPAPEKRGRRGRRDRAARSRRGPCLQAAAACEPRFRSTRRAAVGAGARRGRR